MPVHVNLNVRDVARTAAFYQRWLGFGPVDRRFADGTVFVRDREGTDLARHEGAVATEPAPGFHFGFRRGSDAEIRELHTRMIDGGVQITDFDDDSESVSVKLLDPDAYVVEVYWEP